MSLERDSFTLYAHLPHDTDWSINSYKKIYTMNTLDELINIYNYISDDIIKNCMLFIMKNNIKPMWEDNNNKHGGSFSYRVDNNIIVDKWKLISYLFFTNNLISNTIINGITISPKKNFNVLKIWVANCNNKDISTINTIVNIPGGIFKKHIN
jgi:translation initiation factor 4E